MRVKNWQILTGILLLAILVRFYRIGQVPYGLNFDEASIAYNAWSISIWHRDEFATFMPLSFRSFGDYKPPLVIYLLTIPYLIFGLHPEYVRILAALSGLGSVIVTYFIAKKLQLNSIIPTFLMAISGWAVTVSRTGYEQSTAFFLVNLGMLGLVLAIKNVKYLWLTVLGFGLSIYSFHTAKIFVPTLLISYWIIIKPKTKWFGISLLSILIMAIPLIADSVLGSGGARASTLITSGANPLLEFVMNLKAYVDPRFWLDGWDGVSIRHLTPGFGILYIAELGLFILGLIQLHKKVNKPLSKLLLVWLLAGFLPGLLTTGAPHALRALFALMPMVLVSSMGFGRINSSKLKLVILVGIVINLGFYFHKYYTDYAVNSAAAFQYGYKEAIEAVNQENKTGNKIVITDSYGQPYIYVLLYNQIKPQEFLFGALNQYEFRTIKWPDVTANRIYIAQPTEIPPNDPKVIKVIYIPGTQVPALVVART
jgi:4-amino-4-deoxy-L-arabinose transferase-like glycosyltransferase